MQTYTCIIFTYSYKICELTTLEIQCCTRAKSSHENSYIPAYLYRIFTDNIWNEERISSMNISSCGCENCFGKCEHSSN